MGDWQLLLGIAALVVALMALPTAFQMLWGRPRITFRFSRVVADDGLSVHLLAHLFNLPVTNKFLVWLGVKRDDAHFHAHVLVKDSQGNEVLSYSDPSQRSEPFKPVQHHLHSGPVPVTVETLGASKQNARIYYDNDAKAFHEFKPGGYRVKLDVYCGEVLFFEERAFVVTQDLIGSYWAE